MRTRTPQALASLVSALACAAASAQPLPTPVFSPSGLKPSTQENTVAVGASLEPGSPRPEVLFLDEISRAGALVSQRAELRDDGQPPDPHARDGVYIGRFTLRAAQEGERFFRLRAGPPPGEATSPTALLPITTLPLGLGSSNPVALVDLPDGRDRVFSDQVTIGARPGVSAARVKALVAEVARRLGLAMRIDGYLPRLGAYSVQLGAAQSLERLQEVIAALDRREEIVYASANTLGHQASPLDRIQVPKMRADAAGTAIEPAIFGDPAVGVAVIDTAIKCSEPDLEGRCAALPFMSGSNCSASTFSSNAATAGHGTKVMELLAGAGGSASSFDGVEEGVAWNTRIFPFGSSGLNADLVTEAIDCVTELTAVSGVARIINISWETYNLPNADPVPMRDTVCRAVCDNKLVVAAAGNFACSSGVVDSYPARFEKDPSACSCGRLIGERMLTAGAIDDATGAIGEDDCNGTINQQRKSKDGELFAPGWKMPGTYTNGTSFAAPLISGCAAVLGATRQALGDPWDASVVEKSLKATAGGWPRLLNCAAAVRPPYDVSFVLDRSGSMSTPITGNASQTRWGALALAANGFAGVLIPTALPGSRFGLTLFETAVVPNDPVSALQPIDQSLGTKISSALSTTPSGATAMGAGLLQGLAELTRTGRPRALVLFTDGEQNQPPEVLPTGCEFGPPSSTKLHSQCPAPGPVGSVRIVTVGIGQPSATYLTTLQNIATANRGTALITEDGAHFLDANNNTTSLTTIEDAFAYAVVPALAGNSPQVVTSYVGNLSQSASFAPFDVNQHASQLLVQISFPRSFETPTLLGRLAGFRIEKDGSDVTQHFEPIASGSNGSSIVLVSKLVEAGVPLAGSYQISYQAPSRSEALSFRLVPYVDDHHLELQWGVDPAEPRTLQPFHPTLHLHWDGQPITNANVTAEILKPGDDLGDVLAKHPAVVDVREAPDAGSPGTQKYFHLLATDAAFAAKIRPRQSQLPLAHQSDGKYSAAFDPGDVSGIYQILYRVSAQSAEIGRVQREVVQSVYTRFGKIAWRSSLLDAREVDGAIQIRLRARTGYGRLIGPAQGSAFSVAGTAKLREVTDHQDGSYTLTLDGAAEDPITVSVLGESIYAGPALPTKSWPEPLGLAWWLLILIIVIALVVFLIRRVRAIP
jgi:hypothetical protein